MQQQQPGIPFEDKPYIVADTSHGKYAGNLYIAWIALEPGRLTHGAVAVD